MTSKAIFAALLISSQVPFISAKCGDWAHEECIGKDDPRYDPSVSSNLVDIHPIFGKYVGFWHCTYNEFNGDSTPKETEHVPAADSNEESDALPYKVTDVDVFVNVTIDGTRFYTHELQIYQPAPEQFCNSTPEGHGNVLDDGECGVNGYAKGGDVYRTSTHDKNEYALTAKSSGIYAEGGHHGGGEHAEEGDHGHDDHHLRRMLLRNAFVDAPVGRKLQEHSDHGGHDSHGGGGVEHPLHGVDNVLFAADTSLGDVLAYSVKTFNEDFDKYEMRAGKFDLISSFEIETAKYSCKRAPKEKWVNAVANRMEGASVTDATRESLNMAKNGCLVPPCVTEEELCTQDPSCSVSPYQEQNNVKPGVIAGFCVLGAVIIFLGIVVFYQHRIKKLQAEAKNKFAARMRQSIVADGPTSRALFNNHTDYVRKFDSIDADGSGLISREELWSYISKNEGNEMTEKEFNALFTAIDADGSGQIDFTEFVGFMGQVEALMSES